jgi:hypothetical protein
MSKKQPSSFWQSANEMTQGMKEAIAKQASQAGQAISKKAADVKDRLQDQAAGAAHNLSEAIRVSDPLRGIAKQASQAGQAISHKAQKVSNSATQSTQSWISQVNSGKSTESSEGIEEVYHVFIGYEIAQKGGSQNVTLKSGKSYDIKIEPNLANGCKRRLKKCGLQGNDAFVVFHTLFHESLNIYRQINQQVAHAPIQSLSKNQCSDAYSLLNAGLAVNNLPALDLLDFIVFSANLPREIRDLYIIGSQNSRLRAIEECLEEALAAAYLPEAKKRLIKSAYQFIRSGEAVGNFTALHQLNAIALNSYLCPELIYQYLIAAATSSALALDAWIEQGILSQISEKEQKKYLSVYHNIRDGESVDDAETLNLLDALILASDIPTSPQVIYKLARDRFHEADDDFDIPDFLTAFQKYQKAVKFVQENAANLNNDQDQELNQPVKSVLRTSTFAGNSVAEGKLGLLAEAAFPKQGIGLIRAAVFAAIAAVSEMETQAKIYLGITIPEPSQSNQISFKPAEIYEQMMAMLDGMIYPKLPLTNPVAPTAINQRGLGGLMGNFMMGNLEKHRIIIELEERLNS